MESMWAEYCWEKFISKNKEVFDSWGPEAQKNMKMCFLEGYVSCLKKNNKKAYQVLFGDVV